MQHAQIPAPIPSTMRALLLRTQGGPDGLVMDELPTPSPGTGEALVRVHAASYTPGELSWPSTWVDRRGQSRLPVVPSHEVSGVVAATGFGVTEVAVGDAVFALTDWYRDGAAAEYVVVEARDLAPKPKTLSHLETATLPLAGLTARQALFDHGHLDSGQTVLILGAPGGVGSIAVQLAAGAGAHVIGAGPADARDFVEGLGTQQYVSLPGPGDSSGAFSDLPPVDLIVDTVGAEAHRLAIDLLSDGGRIVSIVEPPSLCAEAAARGATGAFFVVVPDRRGLIELASAVDGGALRPIVGIHSPLEQAGDAIARKQRGTTRGKLAFQVTDTA